MYIYIYIYIYIIWSLKDAETPYTINWSIFAKVKDSTKINSCQLYLTEKYHLIEYFNDICLLNKRVNLLMHVDIKVNFYLRI